MGKRSVARKRRKTCIWVRWLDAHFDAEDDGADWTITDSVGWLLADTDKSIKIAQTVYPDSELESAEVLTIPRQMVAQIRGVRSFTKPMADKGMNEKHHGQRRQ